MVLPQVGEAAVPDITLADRPAPPVFTEQEFNAMPITAKGKILKNQTAWQAYADIAMAAIKGYRNYIGSLFGATKSKPK